MSTTNTENPNHQIRSTYTDNQLRDALITATELRERIFIRGTVGADGAYGSQHWSEDQINDLHTILNVLETHSEGSRDAGEDPSEPPRVWEETKDIQEVRRGDEIRIETKGFVGYYSSLVAKVDISNGWLHFQNGDYYAWDDRDHVSRIPAQIVPPNPDEHTLIYVSKINTTGWETQDAKLIATFEKTYTNSYLAHTGLYLDPQDIVEWEPIDPGVLLERFDG